MLQQEGQTEDRSLQHEGGWTADLDGEDTFGQNQCVRNGEQECH